MLSLSVGFRRIFARSHITISCAASEKSIFKYNYHLNKAKAKDEKKVQNEKKKQDEKKKEDEKKY